MPYTGIQEQQGKMVYNHEHQSTQIGRGAWVKNGSIKW